MTFLEATSLDEDEMLHSATANLGLLFLLVPHFSSTRYI